MTPVPEINGNEEPTANEIKPGQGAAIDAFEEQLVTVADEQNNIDDDEQRRYPRKTRSPIGTLKLLSLA